MKRRIRTGHVRSTAKLLALPLIGLMTGIGVAAITTATLPPTFQASSSVIVMPVAPTDDSDGGLVNGSLALNLVASIAELADSREVSVATAAALGLPEEQVAGLITGVSEPGIQIVTIEATAGTGPGAAAMADAAAAAIITVSQELQLGGSSVVVQPLDEAAIPLTPVSPRPALNYALGALIGLLVGIGFASLRTRVEDRFRRVADIERELGLPALGVITQKVPNKELSARALYKRPAVGTAIDGLVSAISVLGTQRPGRRIVVTGVGDEESTAFVAALLAVGLLNQNTGTTLLEGQWRNPDVQRYFPGHVEQTVEEALAQHPMPDPSDESSTPVVLTAEAVRGYFGLQPRAEQVGALIDALSASGDHVVVTAPPVLAGSGLSTLAQHADVVILIVPSDKVRKADAGRAALLVQRLGVQVTGVVVTGAATDEDGWQPATWPIAPPAYPTGSFPPVGSWDLHEVQSPAGAPAATLTPPPAPAMQPGLAIPTAWDPPSAPRPANPQQ